MQQAQRELTAAQQELQQIVQALEKNCGGKVNESTAGNGKAELVCTAGEATPDKESSKK